MEKIIKVLNIIISAIELAVAAIARILDKAIVAIQTVSKKIISLFLSIFRLLFYLLPFILFILLGSSKNWVFLYVLGIIVLILVGILFIRDFLVAFKENELGDEKELKVEKAGRVIIIMTILNIVTIGYAILFYFFNISIEKTLYAIVNNWVNTIIAK